MAHNQSTGVYFEQAKPSRSDPNKYEASIFETCPAGTVFTITGAASATYTAQVRTDQLENASASLDKTSDIAPTDVVTLTITPDEGYAFNSAPRVIPDGFTAGAVEPGENGTYTCQLSAFTRNTTVIVSGVAEAARYPVTLNTANLKNATALTDFDDIATNELVEVTVTPAQGKVFTDPPRMEATNAHVYKQLAWVEADSCYSGKIDNPTGPVTITVTGEAKDPAYTATLITSGLKGASASLSKSTDIKANDTVTVTVTPEAGKAFASAPGIGATNATVGTPTKKADGSYTCAITGFSGNSNITVTGEATAADKPVIKVTGNGTHVVGAGGTLTFTCSLPLEDLIKVFVDGKELDKANYDAKSGSTIVTLKAAYLDTLAEGKHTIKLSYTGDRAASLDFTVAKAKPLPTDDKNDGSKIAKTGDPLSAAPLAGVAGIALLAGAVALRKKAQQK
ncbi:hypothetical protein [Arabiibacter massiliensis]|uniref:hypothetical protein n=1 Tax=Arabiibacter massiliensis TaxID=1870985 RepID=UPI0009BA39F6|nr:hypothetical protein [Arabiibacter massiliensis]